MKNAFCIGMTIGIIAGALLVNNNSKVRNIVEEAQKTVKTKINKAEQMMNNNNCECASEFASDEYVSDVE